MPSATSAFPTFTPDGTLVYLTGTPTITPSPTATVTPTLPAGTLYCRDLTSEWTCTGNYTDHLHIEFDFNFNGFIQWKSIFFGSTAPDGTVPISFKLVSHWSIAGSSEDRIRQTYWGSGSLTPQLEFLHDFGNGTAPAEQQIDYEYLNGVIEGGNPSIGLEMRSYDRDTRWQGVLDIYENSSLPSDTTPTVTPIPNGNSYCSTVDDSEAASGFGLPIITGGTPVCGGAGGFIIPFSWFQLIGIELDDLIIPFIEVCFVPTSFGILTIANNTIDLDVAAYILGALFLLSLVL